MTMLEQTDKRLDEVFERFKKTQDFDCLAEIFKLLYLRCKHNGRVELEEIMEGYKKSIYGGQKR